MACDVWTDETRRERASELGRFFVEMYKKNHALMTCFLKKGNGKRKGKERKGTRTPRI